MRVGFGSLAPCPTPVTSFARVCTPSWTSRGCYNLVKTMTSSTSSSEISISSRSGRGGGGAAAYAHTATCIAQHCTCNSQHRYRFATILIRGWISHGLWRGIPSVCHVGRFLIARYIATVYACDTGVWSFLTSPECCLEFADNSATQWCPVRHNLPSNEGSCPNPVQNAKRGGVYSPKHSRHHKHCSECGGQASCLFFFARLLECDTSA